MLDGTDLTNYNIKRYGYYGNANTPLLVQGASCEWFFTGAKIYRITGDTGAWSFMRDVATYLGGGLGDIGTAPGVGVNLNMSTTSTDANALFALLELYKKSNCNAYLDLAVKIGDNIVAQRITNGYFVDSTKLNARFEDNAPLALLALEATVRGVPDMVPEFLGCFGEFQAEYEYPDGHVYSGNTPFYSFARNFD